MVFIGNKTEAPATHHAEVIDMKRHVGYIEVLIILAAIALLMKFVQIHIVPAGGEHSAQALQAMARTYDYAAAAPSKLAISTRALPTKTVHWSNPRNIRCPKCRSLKVDEYHMNAHPAAAVCTDYFRCHNCGYSYSY
jgi:hypothetical protein